MRCTILILVILLSACSGPRHTDNTGATPFASIIANLDYYDGKHIKTITYASTKFEEQAAFLTQDDYKNMLYLNSLWIQMPDQHDESLLDQSGVFVIEGRIDLNNHGHLGGWQGAIVATNIEEFLIIPLEE